MTRSMFHRFFISACLTLIGFLATSQLQAQSKTELQAQVARLLTDLAESRKFVSDLSDRLAVLESQQEALLRLRRDLEMTVAERDGLGNRLSAVEAEVATLRQGQAALQERQQALTSGSEFYNATPPLGGRVAAQRPGSSGGDSVQVSDSMSYLNGEAEADSSQRKPRPAAKAVKKRPKKPGTSSRKRSRRRR